MPGHDEKSKVIMPQSDGSITDHSSREFAESLNAFRRHQKKMESIGSVIDAEKKARENQPKENYPSLTNIKGSMIPLGPSEMFSVGGKIADKDLGNMKAKFGMLGRTFKTDD